MFFDGRDENQVKAFYRRLSKLLHPDCGGDAELMSILNEYYNITLMKLRGNASKAEEENLKNFYRSEREADCKYPKAMDGVLNDDPRLELIKDIQKFAKKCKSFNLSFLKSVKGYLSENGYITAGQYNALRKSYLMFRMWEKIDQEEEEENENAAS